MHKHKKKHPKARCSTRPLGRSFDKVILSALPEHLARRYIARVEHWIKAKGLEWAVNRIKAIWNVALLKRSGDTLNQASEVLAKARIRHRADGFPSDGIERSLVHGFIHAERPSRIRRAAVPLRAYTAIRLRSLTPSQYRKVEASINSPSSINWSVHHSSRRSVEDIHTAISNGWRPKAGPAEGIRYWLNCWAGKNLAPGEKLRPRLSSLSGTSQYPNLMKWDSKEFPSKDRRAKPFLAACASMLTIGKVPRALIERWGDHETRRTAEAIQQAVGVDWIGKIACIEELGGKGRIVAEPSFWLQFYLHPYQTVLLREILSFEKGMGSAWKYPRYGMSCAFDQCSGVYLALLKLNAGYYVQGYDLSSATDRFPVELQMQFCKETGMPELASALRELRGPWKPLPPPKGVKENYPKGWQYSAGQGMGLAPSFPLFHLAHYCLLNGLCYTLGLPPDGSNFAVLGDDVLLFDQALARLYRYVMNDVFNVPISYHKSYTENLVEFAGFVITKSGSSWTAFRPYKFGDRGEFSSILNVINALGHQVTRWGRTSWNRAWIEYRNTVGLRWLDLSPMPLESEQVGSVSSSNVPPVHYFDSLINRLLWVDVPGAPPELLLAAADAWYADRYDLCQTEISYMDHEFEGRAVPTDKLLDSSNFDPRAYNLQERERKKTFATLLKGWKQDPLVRWEDMRGLH